MNEGKVAVALCIYKNDKLSYIEESVNSLFSQSYSNFDIYIQVDGPISSEVKEYLYSIQSKPKVNVIFNDDNKGLAFRLNEIIDIAMGNNCYEFLARMDADDISEINRFEAQVEFLKRQPNISIVGSDVSEIDADNNVVFYKRMESDTDLIVRNIIKKCPLNHPSVMFRMGVFSSSKIKYRSYLTNTQDYYLWVDAVDAGLNISNINDALLRFRVDNDFHKRRGFKKSMNEFNSRIYAMKKLSMFSFRNVLHTVLLLFLRLSPEAVKKIAYRYMR